MVNCCAELSPPAPTVGIIVFIISSSTSFPIWVVLVVVVTVVGFEK